MLCNGLMSTLNLGVFGRWPHVNETNFDFHPNQPEMHQGWIGRTSLIVIEDAVVIQTDLFWQTVMNKCSTENEEALVAKELKKQQLVLIATLPNSNVVKGADLLGVSPMDMPGIEPLLPIFQFIKERIDSA